MPATLTPTKSAKTDTNKSRRIEMILRQVDSLPTLPAVALRLLSLTASDESDAREVIETVSADPALTANILAMCRHSDTGVRSDGLTIEKAVLLLGFNAVRNAVLSLKVMEVFGREERSGTSDEPEGGKRPDDESLVANRSSLVPAPFDRTGFWRHSLAVAVAAEQIAAAHSDQDDLPPAEAFVCGLLHDIGKLAIDFVLPKSYDRVAELVDLNQGNIAEFERRVIGIDHHTAGKRLAQQWDLPQMLQDCIWLHGAPLETLPQLDHRRMIGLVRLADLVARQQHIGYSGNFAMKADPAALAVQLDLDPDRVAQVTEELLGEVESRQRVLGLADVPTHRMFLESIQQANQKLGRLNAALDRRSRASSMQAKVLDAITMFHSDASPGRSVHDALAQIGQSAAEALGRGYWAIVHQPAMDDRWLLAEFDEAGMSPEFRWVDPPLDAPDITTIHALPTGIEGPNGSIAAAGFLPLLGGYLSHTTDISSLRVLPLGCGWGTSALLVHDCDALPPLSALAALTQTWGATLAAVSQHEGARRLSEQLAEANQALADAQDQLLQAEAISKLGELASGAAHEMNNPLAIISGRAQLLLNTLDRNGNAHAAAKVIDEQARRLSELITSLRLWADPPQPGRTPTDVTALLNRIVGGFIDELSQRHAPVSLQVKHDLPTIDLDPIMVTDALHELLRNAVQSQPKSAVHVIGRVNRADRMLVVQVIDDGVGMDAHTLSHAMDPFFSAKPAGRLIGMGLPRARQLIAAHGGQLHLRSLPGEGTIATVSLPLDSPR